MWNHRYPQSFKLVIKDTQVKQNYLVFKYAHRVVLVSASWVTGHIYRTLRAIRLRLLSSSGITVNFTGINSFIFSGLPDNGHNIRCSCKNLKFILHYFVNFGPERLRRRIPHIQISDSAGFYEVKLILGPNQRLKDGIS